jgi:hypothetical protein
MKINISIMYLVIFVLSFSTLFYWFEVRPSNIRRDCSASSIESAIQNAKDKSSVSEAYKQVADKGMYNKDDYTFLYNSCLSANGL